MVFQWDRLLGKGQLTIQPPSNSVTHAADGCQVQVLWLKPPTRLLHCGTGHGDVNTAVILEWGIE